MMIAFKDLQYDILVQRPVRWVITDMEGGVSYQVADARHACQILQGLTGSPVSESMFYALRTKRGTKAGVLRHRFTVRRTAGMVQADEGRFGGRHTLNTKMIGVVQS